MKKKLLIVAGILVVLAFVFVISKWQEVGQVIDIEPSNIKSVAIFNAAKTAEFTEKVEIEKAMAPMNQMKVKRRILGNGQKDGFSFMITITYKSGKTRDIVILSKQAIIDGTCFSLDKDYTNMYIELLNL